MRSLPRSFRAGAVTFQGCCDAKNFIPLQPEMAAKGSVLRLCFMILMSISGHIPEAGKNPVPGSRWVYSNVVDLRLSALGPLGYTQC